jgi:hypothetical protein
MGDMPSRRRAGFSNPTDPQNTAPFFKLPYELHSHIYRLVFGRRILSLVSASYELDRACDLHQHILHPSCSNDYLNDFFWTGPTSVRYLNLSSTPIIINTLAWPMYSDSVTTALHCGCTLRTCVSILRMCQRISVEARCTLFSSMFFDFHPTSHKVFHDAFLGPYADGFDPVNHVKYLALRRQ